MLHHPRPCGQRRDSPNQTVSHGAFILGHCPVPSRCPFLHKTMWSGSSIRRTCVTRSALVARTAEGNYTSIRGLKTTGLMAISLANIGWADHHPCFRSTVSSWPTMLLKRMHQRKLRGQQLSEISRRWATLMFSCRSPRGTAREQDARRPLGSVPPVHPVRKPQACAASPHSEIANVALSLSQASQ